MPETLTYFINRIREKLWFRPALICLASIGAVFVAKAVDDFALPFSVPDIEADSVGALLDILASSMLVIAVFAMGSMISAYASASQTATPRSFPLIIADDISQYALSAFIGAFIFSVVAQIAFRNSYFDTQGRFALLLITLAVFTIVILTLLKWVDRIARLGRIGTTIDMVEEASAQTIRDCDWNYVDEHDAEHQSQHTGEPVLCPTIGYLQHIDIGSLETLAQAHDIVIRVNVVPGAFITPARPLAYVMANEKTADDIVEEIRSQFRVGKSRSYDQDPRFGLIVLSEIGSRAMSTSVNDPGTAIATVGCFVRLFAEISTAVENCHPDDSTLAAVQLPTICFDDLFDDAFSAIARDSAGNVEVAVRLIKGLHSIAELGSGALRPAARRMARTARDRMLKNLSFAADIEAVESAASFLETGHA